MHGGGRSRIQGTDPEKNLMVVSGCLHASSPIVKLFCFKAGEPKKQAQGPVQGRDLWGPQPVQFLSGVPEVVCLPCSASSKHQHPRNRRLPGDRVSLGVPSSWDSDTSPPLGVADTGLGGQGWVLIPAAQLPWAAFPQCGGTARGRLRGA